MLFASFYPPIRKLYGDLACHVQPKINCVFEPNSSQINKNDSEINTVGEEDKIRKSKGINMIEVRLDVDNKVKFEINNNDNETHKMIKGLSSKEILTDNYEDNINKTPPSNRTKPEDFFFEVLILNKYLQFFEYNTDILDQKEVDDSDTLNKMIVDFIEAIISADHCLYIQQNYNKSMNLFKKLASLLSASSQEGQSLIENINKYSSSSLMKFIEFPSTLTTAQIFEMKIYHSLHFIYFTQGDYIKQEEEINRILSLDPNDYYAIFGLASVRYFQSKFPEVETLLNEVQKSCKDKDCSFQIEKFTKLLADIL